MRRKLRNMSRPCLALLIALHPILLWQQRLIAQNAGEQAAREITAEHLDRIADEMEKAFDALEAAQKEIPRDTFDPQAIVDKVGKDPDKLFEWVRDHTYWVPYRGSLRGPVGVLMDRLGNSLDRSLLLAELLHTAGHRIQLARAELTLREADQLLPKLRPVPEDPLPAAEVVAPEAVTEALARYATQFGLDAAKLREHAEQVSLQAQSLAEQAAQRVAAQTAALAELVGPPPQRDIAAERAAQVIALQDHWWVQVERGSSWTDLDPILPDAAPGQPLVRAVETISPDSATGTLRLRDELCHQIVVRVVIEQWKPARRAEKVVLQHTLRPSELFGRRIAITHHPMRWPKDLDLFQQEKPLEEVLKETALKQDQWLPVLTIGPSPSLGDAGRPQPLCESGLWGATTTNVAKNAFYDSGELNENAMAQLQDSLGLGSAGRSVFRGLGGGGIGGLGARRAAEDKPSSDGLLTAEWIEYEIHVPGAEARTIRRQVFDLIGPAERQAPAPGSLAFSEDQRTQLSVNLLGASEVLPLPCSIMPPFVGALVADHLSSAREPLLTALRHREGHEMAELSSRVAQLQRFSGNLYGVALARGMWSDPRRSVYLDRPNLIAFHNIPQLGPDNAISLCTAFDIVANDVAVRPGSAEHPFLLRLEQGILDTNAEALLLTECGKVENTAELFAQSNGAGWAIARHASDLDALKKDRRGDLYARLKQDLDAGYVVVVHQQAESEKDGTPTGWWRLNPRTGHVLGIGDRGWGQTAIEEFFLMARVTAPILGGLACIRVTGTSEMPDWAKAGGIAACVLMSGLGGAGALMSGTAITDVAVVGFLAQFLGLAGMAARLYLR